MGAYKRKIEREWDKGKTKMLLETKMGLSYKKNMGAYFVYGVEDIDEWLMYIFVLLFSKDFFECMKNHVSSSQAMLKRLKIFWYKSSCAKFVWDDVRSSFMTCWV